MYLEQSKNYLCYPRCSMLLTEQLSIVINYTYKNKHPIVSNKRATKRRKKEEMLRQVLGIVMAAKRN